MTVEVLRSGSQCVLCCFAPTPSHARRQSFSRASHQALQPIWAPTISTRTRSRRVLKTQSSSDDAIPDRRELKKRSAANRKYFSALMKQQYSVGLVGITAFIAGAQLLQTIVQGVSQKPKEQQKIEKELPKQDVPETEPEAEEEEEEVMIEEVVVPVTASEIVATEEEVDGDGADDREETMNGVDVYEGQQDIESVKLYETPKEFTEEMLKAEKLPKETEETKIEVLEEPAVALANPIESASDDGLPEDTAVTSSFSLDDVTAGASDDEDATETMSPVGILNADREKEDEEMSAPPEQELELADNAEDDEELLSEVGEEESAVAVNTDDVLSEGKDGDVEESASTAEVVMTIAESSATVLEEVTEMETGTDADEEAEAGAEADKDVEVSELSSSYAQKEYEPVTSLLADTDVDVGDAFEEETLEYEPVTSQMADAVTDTLADTDAGVGDVSEEEIPKYEPVTSQLEDAVADTDVDVDDASEEETPKYESVTSLLADTAADTDVAVGDASEEEITFSSVPEEDGAETNEVDDSEDAADIVAELAELAPQQSDDVLTEATAAIEIEEAAIPQTESRSESDEEAVAGLKPVMGSLESDSSLWDSNGEETVTEDDKRQDEVTMELEEEESETGEVPQSEQQSTDNETEDIETQQIIDEVVDEQSSSGTVTESVDNREVKEDISKADALLNANDSRHKDEETFLAGAGAFAKIATDETRTDDPPLASSFSAPVQNEGVEKEAVISSNGQESQSFYREDSMLSHAKLAKAEYRDRVPVIKDLSATLVSQTPLTESSSASYDVKDEMKEKAVSSKREFGIRGLFQDKSRLFVFSASVILGFFLFRFVYAALFASMKKDTAVIHRNLAEESTTSTAKPSFYESFEIVDEEEDEETIVTSVNDDVEATDYVADDEDDEESDYATDDRDDGTTF